MSVIFINRPKSIFIRQLGVVFILKRPSYVSSLQSFSQFLNFEKSL